MDVTGEKNKDGSQGSPAAARPPDGVFVVLLQDRHADPEVAVFSDREIAIRFARETAQEMARHPEDYEEKQIKGLEFFASYSCESDCISVYKTTIDAEIPAARAGG